MSAFHVTISVYKYLSVSVDLLIFAGVLGILCGICEIKEKSWNIYAKGEETL